MLDTTRVLYSLEDICTIPCVTTNIESRKECNCTYDHDLEDESITQVLKFKSEPNINKWALFDEPEKYFFGLDENCDFCGSDEVKSLLRLDNFLNGCDDYVSLVNGKIHFEEGKEFTIKFRKANNFLPIIVAPMSCAFSDINDVEIYRQEGVNVVVPRTFSLEERLELCKTRMTAFSLSEAEELVSYDIVRPLCHVNVCIDMANGHMEKQLEVGSKLRGHFGNRLTLMGGNIANPETFFEYQRFKFDYVRVGIGGGNACLTSTQTSIHYPMASLINDIATDPRRNGTTKIIADGGISDYRDIVKCLALGADYVMMGRIFTKAALHGEPIGTEVSYYGMSTKKAQKEMGGEGTKTSEGRDLKLKKEYTLSGWVENFRDYLRSAMSYTNSRTLDHFRRYTRCGIMSPNSSYLINNK